MRRFLIAFIVVIFIPVTTYAAQADTDAYNEYLDSFDFSSFEELDDNTRGILEEWGIDDFDYSKITSLTFNDFLDIIKDIAMDKFKEPLSSAIAIIGFILLSAFFQSIKDNSSSYDELYSTISALIISTILMIKMASTISICAGTLGIVSGFVYAFIPAFCLIVAAGGGITTSFSTNATLLMLAQGLSFVSNAVFVPVSNCFLALGICSSLRWELHLDRLVKTLMKVITTGISFLSAVFVSVLSIKTAVSARSDMLGLRSIRFAINTVVPVIGSSISEGLLSIQSYSSLIKSSVGIVGIIAVALVFLPAILQIVIWRVILSLCAIVSDIFEDRSVSMVISAFRSMLLIMNVVLILSMVTTIISIGLLIAARTA